MIFQELKDISLVLATMAGGLAEQSNPLIPLSVVVGVLNAHCKTGQTVFDTQGKIGFKNV